MAIKKYHVSKNLFDKNNTDLFFLGTTLAAVNAWSGGAGIGKVIRIPCNPSTTYTISGVSSSTLFRISLIENNSVPDASGSVECIDVLKASSVSTQTFTTTANTKYILVQVSAAVFDDYVSLLMLNTGSTPLPYEPYGNTWNSIPYRKYGTETDILTSIPADVIADGQSASASIIGNMVQTGTPSPSSIIMPSECGDKTANLFNINNPLIANRYYRATDNLLISSPNNAFIYIPIEHGKKYYVSGVKRASSSTTVRWVTTSLPPTEYQTCLRTGTFAQTDIFTITAEPNENYLAIFVCGDSDYNSYGTVEAAVTANCADLVIDNGYKIPISSGGVTTPVYLCEVQTTRRIKKLVLTGEENWTLYNNNYFSTITDSNSKDSNVCVCSHLISSPSAGIYIWSGTARLKVFSRDVSSVSSDLDTFKTWLAMQYANGTPVTIWYVLATETTGVLNEPLRKIGDYSDSVSVSNIPTTGTAESFDIDTTLKPSEVDLTYHGWHEHNDTKFTG